MKLPAGDAFLAGSLKAVSEPAVRLATGAVCAEPTTSWTSVREFSFKREARVSRLMSEA
jgi:hypothetical protein